MAFVYWIHLATHTNMLSDGYIGFTSVDVKTRFSSHKHEARSGNSRHLYAAMRKYGDDIICSTLVEGDVEYCLLLENRLRSIGNIGWNHGVGGTAPSLGISPTQEVRGKISKTKRASTSTVSESTRKLLSELGKGREFSDVSREKMSLKAKARKKRDSWNVPRADKQIWIKADEIYKVYLLEPNKTKASRILSCEFCKLISIFDKFKSGWIPLEDPSWVYFKSNFKE